MRLASFGSGDARGGWLLLCPFDSGGPHLRAFEAFITSEAELVTQPALDGIDRFVDNRPRTTREHERAGF